MTSIKLNSAPLHVCLTGWPKGGVGLPHELQLQKFVKVKERKTLKGAD